VALSMRGVLMQKHYGIEAAIKVWKCALSVLQHAGCLRFTVDVVWPA
jgi:hypothetical protein